VEDREKGSCLDLPVADLDAILERTPAVWRALDGQRLFMTGGTGFFGRWMLGSLLWAQRQHGIKVETVVMSRDPAAFLARFPEVARQPGVSWHAGDVRHAVFPRGEFSHVLHLATDSRTDVVAQPLRLLDDIVRGTRRVLEFSVHQARARRLLYVSSGAVYGAQPPEVEQLTEQYHGAPSTSDPASVYGNAKRLAEQMCTVYAQQTDLEVKIARCFAFVGPHLPLDTHFAVGNFIRDALYAGQVRVNSTGTALRSYLYAADLAVWLWRILMDGVSGRPYNVGSDHAVSIGELAHLVRDVVAPDKPVAIRAEEEKNPGRTRYVPSIRQARDDLQLEVWTPLAEAIARTADWDRHRQPEDRAGTATRIQHGKTFVVDFDGVIGSLTPNNDYNLARPLEHNIRELNRLYDAGHRLILFTARGTMTGIDWRAVTEGQLLEWGVRYHELHFGKPAGDYYIDDRMLPLEELSLID
jgi:nucleoside-diphosphate-sugar epimerase